jgi:long-chain acyl-CoA synthetase
MLTQRNIVSNFLASGKAFDVSPTDLNLSFLPLSHSFQRIFDYLFFWWGASIAYAEHVDKVAENMLEIRPTIMAAVPRFYEKVYSKIRKSVADQKPWKRGLFEWARGVGAQAAEFRRRGRGLPFGLGLRYGLAKLLVLNKLHARVGGRIRFFVSGGGALSREVAEFFHSIGLPILEGYGLSETSPVLTVNRLDATRLGTVGKAIDGVELKIAADGEILARGPNIMKGYANRPEETAQVIQDGWFLTGDIGELDDAGYLTITGRKKELIVTAGGKNVAPAVLEDRLRAHPLVSQCMVIGDGKPFIAALVTVDADALPGWLERSGKPSNTPIDDLVDDPDLRAAIGEAVADANLAVSRAEQIREFRILPVDFTEAGGEMTPTMKVKRSVVAEKYAEDIAGIYAGRKQPA